MSYKKTFLIVFCIAANVSFMFADGKNLSVKVKTSQTAIAGDNSNGSNGVGGESMFTGDVAFSIPLGGVGGVNLALSYSSNIHKVVRSNNKLGQSGWVGLGWSLSVGSIVGDLNNTVNPSDDKYYFVGPTGSSELIYESSPSALSESYVLKDYQYWRITKFYDNATDKNILGWEVFTEDGTIMRYGSYNNTTGQFVRNNISAYVYLPEEGTYGYQIEGDPVCATHYQVAIDGLITSPPSSAYSSAAQIAYRWDLSDIHDNAGQHTTISYFTSLVPLYGVDQRACYTAASYLKKITSSTGSTIEFARGNLYANEYFAPFYDYTILPIQALYETQYLSAIHFKNKGQIVSSIGFKYDTSDVIVFGTQKRFLTELTNYDMKGAVLPSTKFDYFGMHQTAGGTNPGALKLIQYPDNGTVNYTYSSNTVQYSLAATNSYTSTFYSDTLQRTGLAGKDFYVVKGSDYRLIVYTKQLKGFLLDQTFPFKDSSVVDFRVVNDYIMIKTSASQIHAVRRSNKVWQPYDATGKIINDIGVSASLITEVSITGAGVDAFALTYMKATQIGGNECSTSGTKKFENLAVFRFSEENLNVWYLDSYRTTGCYIELPINVEFGNSFFVVTWHTHVGSDKLQHDYWVFRNGSPVKVNSGMDYVLTEVGVRGSTYQQHYYDGMYSSHLFSQNFILHVDIAVNPLYPPDAHFTAYQYNGTDFTSIASNGYNSGTTFYEAGIGENFFAVRTNNDVLLYRWEGSSFNAVSAVSLFGAASFAQCSFSILSGNTVGVGWRSGSTMYFGISTLNKGNWENTKIIESQTGTGDLVVKNSGTKFYVEWKNGGSSILKAYSGSGSQWSASSILTTSSGKLFFQPGGDFVAAVTETGSGLNSYVEGLGSTGGVMFSGNAYDYPVNSKTTSDGMGHNYITSYLFENGVYDESVSMAKYNKATVTPPGSNGKSVTYFYNDLGASEAEDFIDVTNYAKLDGIPYKAKVFAQGNTTPKTETISYWSFYSPSVALQAKDVYHRRLTRTETIAEGITTAKDIVYNDNNGQPQKITEDVNVATNTGLNKDRETEITYAFESHQTGMNISGAHMLIQPFETRVYEKNSDASRTLIGVSRTMYGGSPSYYPISTHAYKGTGSMMNPANWLTTSTIVTRSTTYGVITEVDNGIQDVNKVRTTTKYGYNGIMPVSTITNATDAETKIIVCDRYNATSYGELADGLNVYDYNSIGGIAYSKVDRGFKDLCQMVSVPSSTSQQGGLGVTIGMGTLDASVDYFIELDFLVTAGTMEILSHSTGAYYATQATFSSTTYGKKWHHAKMRWSLGGNGENSHVWFRSLWDGSQFPAATFYLDNIRIYPVDAVCTSQAYDPATLRPISTTDENGVTRYGSTDSFGRSATVAK